MINPAGYTTTSVAILDATSRPPSGPTVETSHHQHPSARRIPSAIVRLEGRQGGDLRIWRRGLRAGDYRVLAALVASAWETMDAPRATGSNMIDQELIRQLAKLLAETGLSSRGGAGGPRVRVARQSAPIMAARAARAAHPGETRRRRRWRPPRSATVRPGIGVVHSPMVGTAYRSPEPRQSRSSTSVRWYGRRHVAHHQSDEDDEPDPAPRRRTVTQIVQGRPAGRIRRAADESSDKDCASLPA